MDLSARIEALVEPALNDLGYTIVEILIMGSARTKVDISIEKTNGDSVSISDCVAANREIAALMDVEDPIQSAYILNVSSPGVDRPLVKPKDFKRFTGEQVKVKTHEFVGERKKVSGKLIDATDDHIIVQLDADDMTPDGDTQITIQYDQIQRAKLDPDMDTLFKKAKQAEFKKEKRQNKND